LLRRRILLSDAVQTGLFAELIFLRRIATVVGWTAAVSYWQGPRSEEHDFTLSLVDVEVKATRSEKRVHQISSLSQLVPKDDRRLFIASVQLTLGAGSESMSLPQLIADVLSNAIEAGSVVAEVVRRRLSQQGWLDEDAPQYATRYLLRTPMVIVPVDQACPAIVPDTLASLGAARFRIGDVAYTVNLDGLGTRDGTKQFDRLLFEGAKP
jgi:hypothetical protein